MGSEQRKRVLQRLLITLGLLVGLVCLWTVVGPSVRNWQVEREIARFARNPSQARADSLVGLLEQHAATDEQGRRILTLLHRPVVTKRSAYPAGLPVVVSLERPFHLGVRGAVTRQEKIWVVGGGYHRETSGRHETSREARTLLVPAPLACQAELGIHQFSIRGTYSMEILRDSAAANVGDRICRLLAAFGVSSAGPPRPLLTYKCEYEIPVEVTVVPKEEAKAIELVSSPQLDQSMEGAFRMRRHPLIGGGLKTSAPGESHRQKAVYYHDLPASAVFRLTVHLSDRWGQVTSMESPTPLVARAGTSGWHYFHCRFKEPGKYRGTVVLSADPNCAYEDPAIDAIWNGEIELPVLFNVPDTQSR